ncbi:protein of unknown function [Pseudomonas mediterranea]
MDAAGGQPRRAQPVRHSCGGGELFIVGERGLLLRSKDNGSSFQALESPYDGSFFGLQGSASGELIAFGLRGNAFWSGDQGLVGGVSKPAWKWPCPPALNSRMGRWSWPAKPETCCSVPVAEAACGIFPARPAPPSPVWWPPRMAA